VCGSGRALRRPLARARQGYLKKKDVDRVAKALRELLGLD